MNRTISVTHFLLLIIIVNVLTRRVAHGEMIFEMDLVEYANPINRTYTLKPCVSKPECQTGFLFCLVDLPFRNPQSCSLGDHVTTPLGGNRINFQPTRSHNYTYSFRINRIPTQGIGMMIEVRDYYEKEKWESIDFYTSTLADVPLSTRAINNTLNITKKFTSLFKYNSSLLIRARLFCAPNHFGPNCEAFCDESPNPYFKCHPTSGERVCQVGFSGRDCQTPSICSTRPCQNEGECSSTDGINYSCKCKQGYSGASCEVKETANEVATAAKKEPIDPCYSMPCFNSGKCKPSSNRSSFECECEPGYFGNYCEADLRRCPASPCPKGCECTEDPANMSFKCKCDSQRILSSQSTRAPGRGGGKGFGSENSAFSFQNLSPYSSLAYYSIDPPVSNVFAPNKFSTFSIQDKKNGNKYNYIKTVGSNSVINFSSQSSINETLNNNATIDTDQSQSNSLLFLDQTSNNLLINNTVYNASLDINNNMSNKQPCIDYNPCRHGQCKLNNVTGDYTCECNVGYMGPFCDLIRHPCDFKPCENGICEIVGDLYYKCLCKPNYTGINCHIEIKPCGPNTCLNGGKCKSLVSHDDSDIGCDCPSNYTGIYCENYLVEENLCSPNPCKNSGVCNVKLINFQPTLECVCSDFYYGAYCEFLNDPCKNKQCYNNGTCVLMNGTNTAQCNCYQGFYGEFCELDLDECVVSSSPCPAGYECHNLYGTFECVPCPPGSKCELTTTTPIMTTTVPPAPAPVPINSVNRVNKNESLLEACSLCKNNATCMINDETDEIVCICQLGYSGFYCELEMDICESGEACLNNGTCILDEKSPGGYICECPRGYSGEICEQKIHICDLENPCLHQGVCLKLFINNNNSEASSGDAYQCACGPNYTGERCEIEKNPCLKKPCQNTASCINEREGEFKCICGRGYEGRLCENDIDMCTFANNRCKNRAKCVDGPGLNYSCVCLPGFEGLNCDQDLDTCKSKPCLNGGVCLRASATPHGYECRCSEGFYGQNCQSSISKAYQEKCKNFCHANATCIMESNRPKCICKSGYYGERCDRLLGIVCENNMCMNGGSCFISDRTHKPECICMRGYFGSFCEKANKCRTDKVNCMHNGTCLVDSDNIQFCECNSGHTGVFCEESLKIQMSDSSGTTRTKTTTSSVIENSQAFADPAATLFQVDKSLENPVTVKTTVAAVRPESTWSSSKVDTTIKTRKPSGKQEMDSIYLLPSRAQLKTDTTTSTARQQTTTQTTFPVTETTITTTTTTSTTTTTTSTTAKPTMKIDKSEQVVISSFSPISEFESSSTLTTSTTTVEETTTSSVSTTTSTEVTSTPQTKPTKIKHRKKTRISKKPKSTTSTTTTTTSTTTETTTEEDVRSSKMELIMNSKSSSSSSTSTSSVDTMKQNSNAGLNNNNSNTVPPRYSVLTLTVVLSCIYGLALLFGIVWIIWLYIRRKTMFSLKNSQLDFNRDFYSTNSIN